ncbi:uncharacterized protein LOC107267716 isoform X2 [Cephus cinctus]|uniref:Uncharacterized protein LOC107267716 isoform X2 n=1 Tax=Cephus cinctus TaxID=211228 RepID=A0AAJ7RH40_CEPCN|nr:uncharacterized protein LOC107267716 isoform X2 [Cephus cinctus]
MNLMIQPKGSATVNAIKESILKAKHKSSYCLVETLEKDLAVLQLEIRHGVIIGSELDIKLEWFNQATNSLAGKIQSLQKIGETLNTYERNEIKYFINRVSSFWMRANKQVYREYAKIRVASRTISGTPLSLLLEKIRKEANAVRVSLQIGEVIYDQEYVSKGYSIFEEISNLLRSLERCDEKIQQYLAICKITPYLLELDKAVDKFASSADFLTISNTTTSELSAFPVLVKLLTGELFGQDTINPNSVMVECTQRKPVFITKNNRRKIDIPIVAPMKTSKNLTYICTVPS